MPTDTHCTDCEPALVELATTRATNISAFFGLLLYTTLLALFAGLVLPVAASALHRHIEAVPALGAGDSMAVAGGLYLVFGLIAHALATGGGRA